MLINTGATLLIVHRRLFEKDEQHYFVGRVDSYENGIVKATGHTFVRDLVRGKLIEKSGERTTFLSLSSGTLLVYEIPNSVSLEQLRFIANDGNLSLTDGQRFSLNLAEHPHLGRA